MTAKLAIVFTLSLIISDFIYAVERDTLQKIRNRGQVVCGVSQGLPGFSTQSKSKGRWEGIDVDFVEPCSSDSRFCRAGEVCSLIGKGTFCCLAKWRS